jgi:hypothetical protein
MTPANALILNQLNQSATDPANFVVKLIIQCYSCSIILLKTTTLLNPTVSVFILHFIKRHTTNQQRITPPTSCLKLAFLNNASNLSNLFNPYPTLITTSHINKAIDTLVNTTSNNLPSKYWFDFFPERKK